MRRRDRSGLWHRPADRVILDEVRRVYASVPVKPGDVLLDLGAHIGAASRYLMDRGVERVVAVEPDLVNVGILTRNLPGALIVRAAVGPTEGRTLLYSAGSHLSTRLPGHGRTEISVPMVTLGSLLAEHRPTIVKCDVEFGEYEIPELRALPEHVGVLAMEVHVRYDLVYRRVTEPEGRVRERRREAADLIAAVERQGFSRVFWHEKQAATEPIEDDLPLGPFARSVDAVWVR